MEELYVDYKRLEEEISILVEKRHDLDIRISRTEVEMDNIQDNMWDDIIYPIMEHLNTMTKLYHIDI